MVGNTNLREGAPVRLPDDPTPDMASEADEDGPDNKEENTEDGEG